MKFHSLALLAAGVTFSTLAPAQRLIVRLAPTSSPALVAARYGLTLRDVTPGAPFALMTATSGVEADLIQARMAADPGVVWAEDDARVVAAEGQAKGQRPTPQKGSTLPSVGDRKKNLLAQNAASLAKIRWNAALADRSGRTVRLAILDTGLSPAATGLWAKTDAATNAIESGLPAYDTPRGTDSNRDGLIDGGTGHGTMVAGVADQVAPRVRFVIARVADSDGEANAWSVVKGLAFAATNGAEVANVSLGSLARVPALSDTMDWCEERGLLVVAAIGNDGSRAACFPAGLSKVVCVGGLNVDATRAPFSNWEGTCDASAPSVAFASVWVDGGAATWSGTSFASPLVAAAFADALRGTSGPQRPDRLRKLPKDTGGDLDRLNPKVKGEIGRLLDVEAMIRALSGARA